MLILTPKRQEHKSLAHWSHQYPEDWARELAAGSPHPKCREVVGRLYPCLSVQCGRICLSISSTCLLKWIALPIWGTNYYTSQREESILRLQRWKCLNWGKVNQKFKPNFYQVPTWKDIRRTFMNLIPMNTNIVYFADLTYFSFSGQSNTQF